MSIKTFDLRNTFDPSEFYKTFDERKKTGKADVDNIVKDILQNVRLNGDKALFEYTSKFDGANLEECGFEVTAKEFDDAMASVPAELLVVIKNAASNIKSFHEKEKEESFEYVRKDGSSFGIKITPISKVGVYVPGGSAPLPSSVLMNIVPAKVAGVQEIIMCTPPNKQGLINPVILAAAVIAGVDRVFKVGGAQAIAAMAYGTESIPNVNKITGPGNAYVATAKGMVFGICGIDMIAGPSEILILADEKADVELVAADMLSQAEHDKMAASVLITPNEQFAKDVIIAAEKQLENLSRKDIAKSSFDNYGAVILVDDIKRGAEISNYIAPEHLELFVENVNDIIDSIQNAGAIFCGKWSPEPMGDYYCGTNHILPTNGTAKFSSPLGVWDFIKRTSVINYSRSGFLKDCNEAALFASAEGLDAHEKSIRMRSFSK